MEEKITDVSREDMRTLSKDLQAQVVKLTKERDMFRERALAFEDILHGMYLQLRGTFGRNT